MSTREGIKKSKREATIHNKRLQNLQKANAAKKLKNLQNKEAQKHKQKTAEDDDDSEGTEEDDVESDAEAASEPEIEVSDDEPEPEPKPVKLKRASSRFTAPAKHYYVPEGMSNDIASIKKSIKQMRFGTKQDSKAQNSKHEETQPVPPAAMPAAAQPEPPKAATEQIPAASKGKVLLNF